MFVVRVLRLRADGAAVLTRDRLRGAKTRGLEALPVLTVGCAPSVDLRLRTLAAPLRSDTRDCVRGA